MQVEQGGNAGEILSNRPQEHGIFLSGAFGTYRGAKSVDTAMQHVFGKGNVSLFNSALNFAEAQDPERYRKIAGAITDSIDSGRRAHVVAHSLGAGELSVALQEIRKDKPEIYNHLDRQDLAVSLIAPSGFFENARDSFNYLGRTFRFLRQQSTIPLIQKSESELRGVDSLHVLPPSEIPFEALTEGLREAMDDLSQFDEGYDAVEFQADRDYSAHIPQEIRDEVGRIDEKLHEAIEQHNASDIPALLGKRGSVLKPYIAKTYEGDYFEEPDTHPQEKFKILVPATIGLVRMLNDMLLAKKPLEEISRLQKNGVNVNFIIPEYDVFLPLDEVLRFFDKNDEDPSDRVVQSSMSAHAFPALQPLNLENVLQKVRSKNQ